MNVGGSGKGGWAAWLGCVTIWGSTFLVIALGNETVPPVWGATLRLALAAAILAAWMLVRRSPWPQGSALAHALGYGFFQFGINMPLLYLGETEVPSGLAAVIFSTIPLSTAVLAHAVGLERMSAARVLGALVAVGGTVMVFAAELTGPIPPLALLQVLGASWAGSMGAVLLKRGPRQSAIAANAIAAGVGVVMCLLWSVWLGEVRALPSSTGAWAAIVYLAMAGSVVAFVLMTWLLNRWPVSRVSFIAVAIPVVALALGAIVRHERITGAGLLGSAVVLVGLILAFRPAATRPAA